MFPYVKGRQAMGSRTFRGSANDLQQQTQDAESSFGIGLSIRITLSRIQLEQTVWQQRNFIPNKKSRSHGAKCPT